MPAPLIAGNWKMNGVFADLHEARTLAEALARAPASARVVLCPPASLLSRMASVLAGAPVLLGGQDCHPEGAGAFTGDISAEMLADAGARLVIVGHSERRGAYAESDAQVAAKALAAARAGLEAIICVGETAEERAAGRAIEVVTGQVRGSAPADLGAAPFALAYEPVWAIGKGTTPTLAEIEEIHSAIRRTLIEQLGEAGRAAPILYGGSVKPDNAGDILAAAEVGGVLVGGASLKAETFLGIIRAG